MAENGWVWLKEKEAVPLSGDAATVGRRHPPKASVAQEGYQLRQAQAAAARACSKQVDRKNWALGVQQGSE